MDAVVLTETWLKGDDSDQKIIGDLTPSGYTFRHIPRIIKTGGAVGMLLRDTLTIEHQATFKARSFENLQLTITSGGTNVRVAVIYRLHPTKKNGLKSSDFVRKFGEFFDSVATNNGHLLILGDFNIHWDCPEKSDTIHLSDTLANLIQHVKEPTHEAGHTIDLAISREGDDFVKVCQCPRSSLITS